MAKAETISTAAKPEDLDKAHASAVKALSTLGLKIALKKPDAAKLGPAMTKSKKKAEIKLSGDAKMIKVTVECDNVINTLGILDVGAERDAQKYAALMKNLYEAGIASKADYEKARAAIEQAKGPDPKVIANIQRELTQAEKNAAGYAGLASYDDVAKIAPVMKELRAYSKEVLAEENFEFLEAVQAKIKAEQLNKTFIDENGPKSINIDPTARKEAKVGKTDKAVAEIKTLIKQDTLAKFKAKKAKELNARIATLKAQLAEANKSK